jgi:hypothetical protein
MILLLKNLLKRKTRAPKPAHERRGEKAKQEARARVEAGTGRECEKRKKGKARYASSFVSQYIKKYKIFMP